MKYTSKNLEQLKKTKLPKIKNGVFEFNSTTQDLEFVNLLENTGLKEIRFTTPQPNLKYINASRSGIEKIVFSHSCPNLKTIYIHGTKKKGANLIHFEIKINLAKLKLIDLSFNKSLTEIKLNTYLEELRFLYLHKCNIKSLQDFADYFIKRDKNKKLILDFNIDENKNITSPPLEIVEQGKAAVVNYYLQIDKEKGKTEYLFEAKLLIIGEGGSGKTSFSVKIQDENAELPKKEDTTLGIDVSKWIFDVENEQRGKQKMYVNLWDFGGQKLYQGTHQIFFSPKSFYVLLDDTRDEKADFAYWLNTVEQLAGEDSKMLILTNKKHEHVSKIDENGLKGRFGKLITNFFEVDLKNDIPKIKKLQTKLKNLLHELPGIGDPLPASWVNIRNDLFKEKENYISYDRYFQICKRNNTDLKQLDFLSDYFNRIGVFTHYYDDKLLKQRIYLNSNWLVNTVYEVLNHKIVKDNNGRISLNELNEIWTSDELFNEIDHLSHLMHRFGLMYEIEGEKTLIIPAHLSANQPYEVWKYENETEILQFAYEFDKYMPRGIMPRIIVALHIYIKNQELVWSKGVNLEHNDTFAEIKETYDKSNKFLIRIFGKNKKNLLGRITHEFEKLLGNYKKLHYEQLIPCICNECKNNKKPFFFKYSELLDRKEANKLTIECGVKPFEAVNVVKLLDGISFGGERDQLIKENPRIKSLKNLILEQYELLNDYETILTTEKDPQEKSKIRRKIAEIKLDLEKKERELKETNLRIQNENHFEKTKYREPEKPTIKPETKPPVKKKSFWEKALKIGGVISAIIFVLAAIAELSGFSLRDLF